MGTFPQTSSWRVERTLVICKHHGYHSLRIGGCKKSEIPTTDKYHEPDFLTLLN